VDLVCPDCGHRARVSAPGDYVCGDCQRAGRAVRMVPRGADTAADLRPGDRFRFLHQPGAWTTVLSVERHGGMLTVRTPERGYMVRPDTPVEVG
jgi:tRNA(Ile2) C34 agmatinyltransferase TiaS